MKKNILICVAIFSSVIAAQAQQSNAVFKKIDAPQPAQTTLAKETLTSETSPKPKVVKVKKRVNIQTGVVKRVEVTEEDLKRMEKAK